MILKSRIKVAYAENLYNTLKREYIVIIYPFIMEVFKLSAMVVYGELIMTVGFLLLRCSVVCTVKSLSLFYLFYILICVYKEMMHRKIRYL